jgi:phosphatidylglycerophosphate synthase
MRQFLLLEPRGGDARLLGLGLVERARRMLTAAGLVETQRRDVVGELVIYPAEIVGPGALGKEIAATPAGTELRVGDHDRAIQILPADAAPKVVAVATPAIVYGPGQERAARRLLLRCLRKPVDGLISRSINRPISLALSSLFVRTPLTPNMLTTMTFLIALSAADLMASGNFLAGALVMQFSSILDGCDGEVARLKYQTSRLGGWLDTIFDDISNMTFIMATAWGLAQKMHHGGPWRLSVIVAGVGAVIFGTIANLLQYRRVVASGHSDTGALTYGNTPGASPLRRFLATYLHHAVKRDFYYFAFIFLTAAHQTKLIVYLSFLGALIAAITIVSERRVTPWSRSAAATAPQT